MDDRVKLEALAATLRIIQVGSQQLTEAMYEQLLNEQCIDHHGGLCGIVWGWVNACPKNCIARGEPHRHFIWQRGADLRRCSLFYPRHYKFCGFRSDDTNDLLRTVAWRELVGRAERQVLTETVSVLLPDELELELDGIRIIGDFPTNLADHVRAGADADTEQLKAWFIEGKYDDEVRLEALKAKVLGPAKAETARCERVCDAVAAVYQRPQIFL